MAAQGWAGTALPSLSLGTAGIKEWGGEVTMNDQCDVLKTLQKGRGWSLLLPNSTQSWGTEDETWWCVYVLATGV